MKTYILTNTNTGDTMSMATVDRKTAHEIACANWPGVPVEVVTSDEKEDRELLRRESNQIYDWLEGIDGYIYDSEYANVLRCLEAIKLHVQEMELYFEGKLGKDR